MSQLERVMHLRSFTGLRDLDPAKLAVVAEHSVEHFFPAGSEIYAEGKPVEELHYIISGRVAVKRGGKLIDQFGAMSVIGGLSALSSRSDGQQVVATEDTVTLGVSEEDQTDVFEDNFDMALAILRAVAFGYIAQRKEAGPDAGFSGVIKKVEAPTAPFGLVDKLAVLRHSITFGATRIEALAELAHDAIERRYPAGHELWQEGDASGNGRLLVSGVIACRRDDQQFRFGPGSMVGGIGGLARIPRWYTAKTETEVVALELPIVALLDMFEDNVDLMLALLGNLADAVLTLREANPNTDTLR
jgi:CRP-like cAMP-binding protein